jgi:hypothetical protein
MKPESRTTVGMSYEILERIELAVLKVRERLLRATSALAEAGISYAVIGGNAAASWVATVDEGAVRNCPDVELLVRRGDFTAVARALEAAAFVRDGVMFLDGPDGKPRQAVRLVFSGERIEPRQFLPAPEIETVPDPANFHVLQLELLVSYELGINRTLNKVQVRDFIDVGLVDATWPARFPPELAARLQHLLDTPDG